MVFVHTPAHTRHAHARISAHTCTGPEYALAHMERHTQTRKHTPAPVHRRARIVHMCALLYKQVQAYKCTCARCHLQEQRAGARTGTRAWSSEQKHKQKVGIAIQEQAAGAGTRAWSREHLILYVAGRYQLAHMYDDLFV